jgi:glycosyltransferase involved in cell wall biosynthesis
MPNRDPEFTRCDLHLHSSASVTTGEWFSKYFGCPESYADPVRQYELCKLRGMTLVTLTDHDSIEGGLQLIDRPDFFLSEEVTTRFPENGCVMHVLVWGITPAQHLELQRLRENVYELSGYLRTERLAHALAHPMLSSNWRLDAVTLERCLALFPVFESVNGTFDRRCDPDVAHLLAGATPGVRRALSRKHGIPLHPAAAGALGRTGGSDDHAGRRCGSIFTEVDGALDVRGFLERVSRGDARPIGTSADLNSMAMTVHGTTYEYFRRSGESRRNPFTDVVERLAGHDVPIGGGSPRVSAALTSSLLWAVSQARLPTGPELDLGQPPLVPSDEADARYVAAVARTADTLLGKAVAELAPAVLSFNLYGLLGALAEISSALMAIGPYLFAADHLSRQADQIARVWRDWTAFPPPAREEHLAVFSDSLTGIDGVATWCTRFGQQAAEAGRKIWFASCGREGAEDPDRLPAVARFDAPLYEGFELAIPSLAATIDRLWRKKVTHVELATPGPLGLVGLAAARLLRLPVTATYHTDLPALVEALTGEREAAGLARGYVRWFYGTVDRVLAMSEASREKLVAMGVTPDRIGVMPVAVNPGDFTPARFSPDVFSRLGVESGGRPVVLSVGRVSPEKNLPLVIEAVERLQHAPARPLLVVVGDGPARGALEELCREKPFVRFVGFQQGEVLRSLYASSRAFVFASDADTLGLVNLEAMASGLPVLVPRGAAIGGALTDGENALLFDPTPVNLAEALRSVLDDPSRAATLSRNARRHAVSHWGEGDFGSTWQALCRGLGELRPRVAPELL